MVFNPERESAHDVVLPLSVLELLGAPSGPTDGSADAGGAERGDDAVSLAGASMGRLLASRLGSALPPGSAGVEGLPVERFWTTLSDLLRRRGWGEADFSRPHPGVGILQLHAGPAGTPIGYGATSRVFARAMLSALVSETAGAEVAVLALEDEEPGERFAFGSAETIGALSRALSGSGQDLSEALESL